MESLFYSSLIYFPCILLLVCNEFVTSSENVEHKVRCLQDTMLIDLVKTEKMTDIYLDQLKNYPDDECQAKIDGDHARLHLSLTDIHRCGVTRVINRMTGTKVYYHKVVIEHMDSKSSSGTAPVKEYILVKCSVMAPTVNHTVTKRNVLPAGFTEPEDLEVTTTLTGKAPEPMLSVGVRQGKEQVTGELNVNPGTPLTMEIFLDKASAPIYGVLVSYMQVTDTKQQEETIIFNGCSVDPYLFENFNTINGDFLSAKFRAFKFPDSTYVQFRGTVNVCLDKCKGIECSNGQIGYGRRRKRDVSAMPADPNKVFEVSLTTFIKINFIDSKTEELRSREPNATENVFILKDHLYGKGNREGEMSIKTVETKAISNESDDMNQPTNNNNNYVQLEAVNRLKHDSDILREELKYAVVMESSTNNAQTNTVLSFLIVFPFYFLF